MSTESEPLLAATDDAPDLISDVNDNGGSTIIQDGDDNEPVYLETIKLIPISIAMGLAIFILGLVSHEDSLS